MSRRRQLLALVVVAGSLVSVGPARADHAGAWHWAFRTPVVVDGTSDYATESANKRAVSEWNALRAGIQLAYRVDPAACGRPAGYHEILVCYGNLGHEGGEARTYASGADGDFHFTSVAVTYDLDARGRPQYLKLALACHELGHALGLGHHDDPNDGCMHPATTRGTPGDHDAEALRQMYGHADGSTASADTRRCYVGWTTGCFLYRPS